jgi:hypothetical protein
MAWFFLAIRLRLEEFVAQFDARRRTVFGRNVAGDDLLTLDETRHQSLEPIHVMLIWVRVARCDFGAATLENGVVKGEKVAGLRRVQRPRFRRSP